MKIFLIITGLLAAFILVLGAFPWGVLHGTIENRLSMEKGRPATVITVERRGAWSLTPTVTLKGVAVPQASWAGEGNVATIESANIRFSALPLLIGRTRILSAEIDGMALLLARDKDGRKSWSAEHPDEMKKGSANSGEGPQIRTLVIRNATISYDDAVQDRRAEGTIVSDDAGFIIEGDGFIHGNPVRLIARGAPVVGGAYGKPWPFRAEIIGDAVGMIMDGEMETPLSFGRFTAKATAHGDNLSLIDAIIEAGLMETQPVTLAGDVIRASPDWIIRNLTGKVGRSDIAGEVIVKKGPRTFVDGKLTSQQFDFDDLSSDEGMRKAAEKRVRVGERIFPDTAIDLDEVDDTDGRLEFSVEELLWKGSSPFQSMQGVITVDHQLLTVRPLEVGLKNGVMTGDIVIDQRNGADEPTLDFTLETGDARFADFFPGGGVDGALKGHIKLAGTGDTVRKAIGKSTGSVALVTTDGVIPRNTASMLGQDVGRGLTADEDKDAALRCIVARLDVTDGKAAAGPVLIDTSRALTTARGGIDFDSEALNLSLHGVPKISSVVRLEGDIPVAGTIKAPDIGKPDKGDSVGEILKSVGEAIIGDEDPIAEDADCDALAAEALR